ncbi:MAG: hypothetical protein H7175_00885 [Burkholderiales bacterium]|nr:hypothetical protein [Anaerolineae bacterium]
MRYYKPLSIVLVAILSAMTVVLLSTILISRQAQAQESGTSMQERLSRFDGEIDSISFQFVTPLVADEIYWNIPDGLDAEGDVISIDISEIGEDYICFRYRSGEVVDIMCTPFNNIVSFSYLSIP